MALGSASRSSRARTRQITGREHPHQALAHLQLGTVRL